MRWKEQVRLCDYCTLRVGGPARYFLEVRSVDELRQAFLRCKEEGLRYFLLGKGSNCFFDDAGFDGLVIFNRISTFSDLGEGFFQAGSGYSFSMLGSKTAKLGWSGLEFASGIPGSVGGAVYMNAGANGRETADALFEVDYLHENGSLEVFSVEDLEFSYRKSPFQEMKGAVVAARFHLIKDLSSRGRQLDIVAYRKNTQPLSQSSAGCWFRNPEGDSAGRLIDELQLKGMSIGQAEVSTVHGNFLLNKGGASSEEVLELSNKIKKKIEIEKGVSLRQEVMYIPSRGLDEE